MNGRMVAAMLLVVGVVLGARAEEPEDAESKPLVMGISNGSVVISRQGKPIVRYQGPGGAKKELSVESGCYFHPLSTPGGVIVTDVAPDDHRHHRGIFLAFVEMHGPVDADFWGWGEHAPTEGRAIVNRQIERLDVPGAGFVAHNEWKANDTVLINEQLQATVQNSPAANVLDLEYTLTPTADLKLSQWAFSGFCVRTRKDGELTAHSPQGEVQLPNPNHMQPASDWPAQPWYAYTLRLKDDQTVGVAVIDHPQNPPALWHNHRDVRMLNPCIVAPSALELTAGKPLVLRYRVVAYDGATSAELLNRLAKEFAVGK